MDILDFYTSQSPFTDPGQYEHEYEALPDTADEIVTVVRGLLLDFMDRWKHPIQNERWLETSIRYVDEMIQALWTLDKKAPTILVERPADMKMMASPSHFASMVVSILRYKGIPARKRTGYVPSGEFFKEYGIEDSLMSYEIVEYWDDGKRKTLDPAGRGEGFVSAARIYKDAREGKADLDRIRNDENFGMDVTVAILVHDLCAVTGNEIISWDRFGIMNRPTSEYTEDDWARLDALASLLSDDDENLDALLKTYEDNKDFRVPRVLFCDTPLVPPHEMVTRVIE